MPSTSSLQCLSLIPPRRGTLCLSAATALHGGNHNHRPNTSTDSSRGCLQHAACLHRCTGISSTGCGCKRRVTRKTWVTIAPDISWVNTVMLCPAERVLRSCTCGNVESEQWHNDHQAVLQRAGTACVVRDAMGTACARARLLAGNTEMRSHSMNGPDP